jgi:hypothetical protein
VIPSNSANDSSRTFAARWGCSRGGKDRDRPLALRFLSRRFVTAKRLSDASPVEACGVGCSKAAKELHATRVPLQGINWPCGKVPASDPCGICPMV